MVAIPVYLEVGSKRVFAASLDWPGWARAGKTEEAALEALAAYADRYVAVLKAARVRAFSGRGQLEVVDRLKGDASTDFGIPAASPPLDAEPLEGAELDRYLAILRASWAALDRASKAAKGVVLRKGPRGGGRSRVAIVDHVTEAEGAYSASLAGGRPKNPTTKAMRTAFLDAVKARAAGDPLPEGRRSKKPPWTPRYGVRREAWHVLDHAWEIEDRATS